MAGRRDPSSQSPLSRLWGPRSLKADAFVDEDIAGCECPGKRHSGSRGGRRPYEGSGGFVESRANRRFRQRRYECDGTSATIDRPDGNPPRTVITADRRGRATIAGARAERRGRPGRDLMSEQSERRGAARRDRHYSEIATIELQR